MTKKLLFLTSFFLCISMLSSCGIALEDKPRNLSAELPDTLIEGAITTTEAPSILETVQIFLAKDSEEGSMFLEIVEREIEPDGSVKPILEQILNGPTADEQERGLVSPFAEGSSLVGTTLEGSTLLVHLDTLDGFPTDDSASNQLAFAMLVCTSTELLMGIEIKQVLVLLERDDQTTAVNAPVSDGEPPADGEAVRCSNYITYMQDSQLPLKS
ncbi:GerMN domain-containing protein [Acidimicrobiaceae bacterium]|nr:GerMN domain-containing protein [Acidimicrobiaceae bacterium]